MYITKDYPTTITVNEDYPNMCQTGELMEEPCVFYSITNAEHNDLYERKIPYCKKFSKFIRGSVRCAKCKKHFGVIGNNIEEGE